MINNPYTSGFTFAFRFYSNTDFITAVSANWGSEKYSSYTLVKHFLSLYYGIEKEI
jgi:hypothetical protein